MKRGDMRAFLLTYNPAKWPWDLDDLAEEIEATALGHPVLGRWSTGSTWRKIAPGDRAFLLRQGSEPRGIFASGTFETSVFESEHWDGTGRTANFADVRWDTVLDPDTPLPLEVVRDRLPDAQWSPQASGTEVPTGLIRELEELWADHVGHVRSQSLITAGPISRAAEGQQRRVDSARRKAIEDAAQQILTEHYTARGWKVEDVRYGNPFDAVATRGDEVLYLEAKGTTTAGQRVIVTRNEVAFAREHPEECVMGIVAGLIVDASGRVDPSSGELRLYAWNPEERDLDPLTYDFIPRRYRIESD